MQNLARVTAVTGGQPVEATAVMEEVLRGADLAGEGPL